MLAVFFVLQLSLELTAVFSKPKLLSLLLFAQLNKKKYSIFSLMESVRTTCHSVTVECCEIVTGAVRGSRWVSLFWFFF